MSFGLCSPGAGLIFQPADSLPCKAHFVLLIYLCIPPPEPPLCQENHLLRNLIPFKWLIFSFSSSFFLNLMWEGLFPEGVLRNGDVICPEQLGTRQEARGWAAALKVSFTPRRDRICYISCSVDEDNSPTSFSCHRNRKRRSPKGYNLHAICPESDILDVTLISLWPSCLMCFL